MKSIRASVKGQKKRRKKGAKAAVRGASKDSVATGGIISGLDSTVEDNSVSLVAASSPGMGPDEPMSMRTHGVVVKADEALRSIPYYHGMLGRQDIVPLLKNQGDFLLRQTEDKARGLPVFALSVMWDGTVRHFLVSMTKQGMFFLDKRVFATVSDLVDYYQYGKLPLLSSSPARLTKAVQRPEWQLTHEQIKLGKKLGEGAYGEVFKATLKVENGREETVAVKTMRQMKTTREEREMFLAEARLMRGYHHPNLAGFLGVAVQRSPLMIVLEFCPGGDLHSHLIKTGKGMWTTKKVRYCLEAAEGMLYLEKAGTIHRDIAARNCLIGAKDELKIADFGLSMHMTAFKETTMQKVPIRWLAPETLREKMYSSKTDVWSFGVLVWEIFNNGQKPYDGLTNQQVKEKVVHDKLRLVLSDVPPGVAKITSQCWNDSAGDRPTFLQIRDAIKREL